ncbi:MAG: DUF5060 domain-containing protein [Bacteroidetes bacterium]|nr:DUF5060 domain-containing protein [Bacteroidota bacterium]
MKHAFLILIVLSTFAGVPSSRSVFRSVVARSGAVGRYGLFQLDIRLDSVYANPYDYGDVTVRCIFVGPAGVCDTVDGFYMSDYRIDTTTGAITLTGGGHFSVRYSPVTSGKWSYRLFCLTRNGRSNGPAGRFSCYPNSCPGFVRRTASAYLSFDNGAVYVPIGENMGWPHTNAYLDYSRWVSRLAANGGNCIRVWMPAWGLGLEWQKGSNGYGGLGRYKQQNAGYLDWLLELCEAKGVFMMLSLDHHGQVSSQVDANWNGNPYNAANGGPCTHTWDFFADEQARRLIRNRFRYIAARYGYSRNILCWELFNEVDWTDDFARHRSEVTAWHKEMAAWLKHCDVNRHLVTTSYGSAVNDPECWRLPGLDFTQTHYYTDEPLDSVLNAGSRLYRESFGKPTLNGEFGLSGDGSRLAVTDEGGIYVHNSLWSTLLGGALGPGLPWYWDNYIDRQDLYVHFRAVASFAADVDFIRDGYAPVQPSLRPSAVRVYALRSADSSRLAAWILNKEYGWRRLKERGVPPPVSNARITVPGIRNGAYLLTWSDCLTGKTTSSDTVTVKDGMLRVVCPGIEWDRALRMKRLISSPSCIW